MSSIVQYCSKMKVTIYQGLRTDVVSFIYKADYASMIWLYFQGESVNIKEIFISNKPDKNCLIKLAKTIQENKISKLFLNKSAEYIFRKIQLPGFVDFEFINLLEKNIDAAYVLLGDYLNNENLLIADAYKYQYLEETKLFNLKRYKEESDKYPQLEAMLQAMAGTEFQYLPNWSFLDMYSDEELNYQSNLIGRLPFSC